ncbi:MAG: hypothetical protein IJW59_00260 [Clostridia bacterium]|nr:hypothetical protein [Clostridia bacterium]
MKNNILKKIIHNSNVPIMTDEGLLQLLDYWAHYREKLTKGGENGPSRRIVPKPFVEEESVTYETLKKWDLYVFKSLILAMERDMKNNDSFFTKVFAKRSAEVSFNKFKKEDFFELIELVKSGNLEKAILTPLGNVLLGQASVKPGNEHSSHIDSLPLTKGTYSGDIARIYINTSNGAKTIEFLARFRAECFNRGLPCDMKPLYNSATKKNPSRADGTIIYAPKEVLEDYLDILKALEFQYPSLVENFGSPLTSACNTGCFAVCSAPEGSTYNLNFDYISNIAFCVTLSSMVLDKFREKLTPVQVAELEKFKQTEEFVDRKLKNRINDIQFTRSVGVRFYAAPIYLMDHYGNFFEELMQKNRGDCVSIMREKMQRVFSLANWGDLNHLDYPICFDRAVFEEFDIDFENIDVDEIDLINEPKKRIYTSKELQEIKNAGSIMQLIPKYMLLGKGHSQQSAYKMTERQLRQAIFKEARFDDETIIKILRGGDVALKSTLLAMGCSYKQILQPRYELERLFIALTGVDAVINASDKQKALEAKTTGKHKLNKYENALLNLRQMRVEQILKNPEVLALKKESEKQEFLSRLSTHCLEDLLNSSKGRQLFGSSNEDLPCK